MMKSKAAFVAVVVVLSSLGTVAYATGPVTRQGADYSGTRNPEQIDEFLALADRVAELESRPCPHVRTSGTTSHCTLAERDARDAERYRHIRHDPSMLLHLRNSEFDAAIDAAIKEQADATKRG